MSDKPNPSPEAVIKSLEACAEPFAGCDDCAFGPCDPYDYGCADKLKLTAAELLRAKYVPGEWAAYEDDVCETVYKCPACGEEFTLIDGTLDDYRYSHCPNCGKRLTIPKEV